MRPVVTALLFTTVTLTAQAAPPPLLSYQDTHEVYVRAADGAWKQLTPGYSSGDENTCYHFWDESSTASETRGSCSTGVDSLAVGFLLPTEVELRTTSNPQSGGGMSFGWEDETILVR